MDADRLQQNLQLLVEKARAGSVSALNHLLAYFRPIIVDKARNAIGPQIQAKVDASDLAQQTLMRAAERFEQFRGATGAEFRGWLLAIQRNLLLDAAERVPKEKPLQAHQDDSSCQVPVKDPFPTPRSLAGLRERDAEIETVLGRLPEHYQRLLRFRFWENLSYQEIADRMELLNEDATKAMCWRALRQLKEELRGHGNS